MDEVDAYAAAQSDPDAAICRVLRREIDAALPEAEARIWHAHPVWFLKDNPIVGYRKLKRCIRLLFWSGRSFDAPGLTPEGRFKAAEARYTDPAEIDADRLRLWLAESRAVQWDDANVVRRRGRLERLPAQ